MKKAGLLAVLLLVLAAPRAHAEPLTVFAAASLTDAMQAVGEAFRDAGGGKVRFSFASSSTLARQIEAGAPADVFASANERWMDYLAERDLVVAATRTSPIANRLVLVVPTAMARATIDLDDPDALLGHLGPSGRLAVGDPAHVPAGIYARQALETLGLWDEVEPRLARADNVRAALALVARGETPMGIVYTTDVRVADGVRVAATFPASSHAPITYPFAVVAGADSPAARDFLAFAAGEPGLEIFARFGFERP